MEEGAQVATPGQVDVWVGLDVGKEEHFADVLDDALRPAGCRGPKSKSVWGPPR